MTLFDVLKKSPRVRMRHWRPQIYWYWDGHKMHLSGTEITHTHLSMSQAMSEEWEVYHDVVEVELPDNVLPFPTNAR